MNMRAGAAKSASTWLTSLARDTRGNTMAIVAAAIIPLAGMVGGGVDISRMYIVKTRLQHACDAGALAGRKQMGGGTWSFNSNAAQGAANRFFDANIQANPYGAASITRTFTESAGKVSGAASASVPMTIMRVFGRSNETLNVTCDAEMRLPNTDVMFVLDTTGSMDDKAVSTDPQTKIQALKSSVKCFYEIVARLDTAETCATGAPSGGTGNTVQIRFGFMPYATNVNVGKLLPTNYFADSWTYQTREQKGMDWGDWQGNRYHSRTGGACVPQANTSNAQYRSNSTGYSGTSACYEDVRYWVPNWRYAPIAVSISGLKNGTSWNNSFTMPLNNDASNRTITWDGCIEERKTVWQTAYSPIPAGAKDLNIDLVPGSGDPTTQWGPALPQLIYARDVTSSWSQLDRAEVITTTNYYNSVPYYCPREAKKLQSWPTASDFEAYVNGLTPDGNTYHDTGLLWGARFISPTGIFKSENEYTPQGGEIERHLIFMTDGEACTNTNDYGPYGLPWLDRRTTDPSQAPTSGCLTTGTITQQVNARTAAICTAVKNKNITLWVIWFGASNTTIEGMLNTCATPGRFFTARNSTDLQNTFKSIADQISQLRLTR
jgi:Flp pilus assembly protein TadG